MTEKEREALAEKQMEVRALCESLVFEHFDCETAWWIGSRIREKALERGHKIIACVTMNRRRLFYMAIDGTPPIFERWLTRKENTVYTFFESSMERSLFMRRQEETFSKPYGLSDADYVASGGSVPIRVKGAGIVGTITISGLTEEEDHALVVETIQEYLNQTA